MIYYKCVVMGDLGMGLLVVSGPCSWEDGVSKREMWPGRTGN